MKHWPIVGLVGPRQSGKSVLLRDLLPKKTDARYLTMDSKTDRDRAEKSPEAFSKIDEPRRTFVFDEIQKVPDLFDSLKLHVDEHRRPGMYVISGSTEFSKFTGIRESLTGRIAISHLFPMLLAELFQDQFGGYFLTYKRCTEHLPFSQFDMKLERGGMPGLCFIRDRNEFDEACRIWLDTTCFRDLAQNKGQKLDGELALEILGAMARATEPTALNIGKELRRDTRVIQRHIDALCRILVVRRLDPHPSGVGKPEYVLCDSGLAYFLGAPRHNLIRTHVIIEALAAFEYAGHPRPRLQYYRNAKTSRIPIVLSWSRTRETPPTLAIQFFDGESPFRAEYDSLRFFSARTGDSPRLLLLTQTRESYRENGIEVHPLRG